MSTFVSWRCAFFFFTATAASESYTLSLHDALPISRSIGVARRWRPRSWSRQTLVAMRYSHERTAERPSKPDRKSTRLNSSHRCISYAVFCLKKKKSKTKIQLHKTHPPNYSHTDAST